MAPSSLLQQKLVYPKNGNVVGIHYVLDQTVRELLEKGINPEILLPNKLQQRSKLALDVWNHMNDPTFCVIEELTNVARIFMLLAIADNKMTDKLLQAYTTKNPLPELKKIIDQKLEQHDSSWLAMLVGSERYKKILPQITSMFIHTMERRRLRQAAIVQTAQPLWQKLLGEIL